MKFTHRIKQFFSIFFLLSLSSIATAEDIKPAIWKVEHQGTTSYLLGSIHIGSGGWYPLPSEIMQGFKASEKLVVELNSTKHEAAMTKQMMLPVGQTLQSNMSPDLYTKFEKHMESMGMPASSLAPFKPWAAATVVAVLPYLKAGLQPQFGIDAQFISRAKKRNMPIIELETAQFQINLLSSIFSDEKMFIELLEQPAEESYKLIEFWKNGDMDSMEQLMESQMTVEQRHLMLTQRNNDWIDKLTPLFNTNIPHFIVVGAAHMAGSGGVPALLNASGIKVVRIQ